MSDVVGSMMTGAAKAAGSAASSLGSLVGGVSSAVVDDYDGMEHPPEAFQRQVSAAEDEAVSGGDELRRAHHHGGTVWHFLILADDNNDAKHCTAGGSIKPCRALPVMRASDFFETITQRGDGAWVLPANLSGVNGWPGIFYELEVMSVTGRASGLGATLMGQPIKRFWSCDAGGNKGRRTKAKGKSAAAPPLPKPAFPTGLKECRVTLLAPEWTLRGFTEDNPGLVYWATTGLRPSDGPGFKPNSATPPPARAAPLGRFSMSPSLAAAFPKLAALPAGDVAKVAFGAAIGAAAADGSLYDEPVGAAPPQMTHCSVFAHRYATKHESAKDMLTYHTGVFVQWDHQAFGTIMELAWLWGATGYKSKANWHADKNAEGGTTFAAATPPALVAPWDNHRSEIRVYDVPMRDAAELAEYMKRFSGVGERFFVPAIVDSAPVRLTHRSQPDLCTYLTNYLGHDGSYHESSRNCQTFTADLFGFLAGKKTVKPYAKVNQILYKARHWQFLYVPPEGDEDDADGRGSAASE